MSVYKEIKPKLVRQENGLVNLSYLQSLDTKDFGFVGEYNTDTTATYAGIFRDATDNKFKVFDALQVSPFATDSVDTGDGSYTDGTLELGVLTALTSVAGGNLQLSGNNLISTDTNGAVNIAPNGTGNVATTTTGTGTITLTTDSGNITFATTSGEVILPADPTSNLGAATKQYVDSVASGLDPKDSVRVRTTSDLEDLVTGGITASGTGVGKTLTRATPSAIATDAAAFDGITLIVGDRVLVAEQGSGAGSNVDNGIYIVTDAGSGISAWVLTRATDFDEDVEVTPGAFTFVEEGSVYADTGHVLSTDGIISIDTTGLDWSQFSSAGIITASNVGTGSGTFKNKIGNDLQFRSLLSVAGTNTADIIELTENTDDVTFTVDQLKITGTGALDAGTITSNFGDINNGASNITTTGVISGGQATIDSVDIDNGIITFSAGTGLNKIVLPDGLSNAMTFESTDALAYLRFITSDSAEEVQVLQNFTANGDDTFLDSGLRVATSDIDATGSVPTTDHFVKSDATAGAITLTLPTDVSNAGRIYRFLKTDSSNNSVVIEPTTGQRLDGIVDDTIALKRQYDHVELICAGSGLGWYVL
jgi:hypothetical protein